MLFVLPYLLFLDGYCSNVQGLLDWFDLSCVCVCLSRTHSVALSNALSHSVLFLCLSIFPSKHTNSLAFSLPIPLSSFRVRAPLHSRWPSLNLSCHPESDYTSLLFCLSLSLAHFPRSFSEVGCFPRCPGSDDLSYRSNSFILSQTLII